MLLKEHRFKFFLGVETYLFTIEELVTGLAGWPDRFRIKLAASKGSEAKTFYGPSCYDVAEKAARYIVINSPHSALGLATHWPAEPSPPRQLLQQQRRQN